MLEFKIHSLTIFHISAFNYLSPESAIALLSDITYVLQTKWRIRNGHLL
jgi:hypothetical protein